MKKPSPDRTAQDRALWEQVTQGITPLHRTARSGSAAARPAPPSGKTDYTPRAPVHPSRLGPVTAGSSDNMDAGTYRRLRSGELPLAGKLDLHGMTQTQAHTALIRFIHHGYHNGRRCVLVITGRSGVLREQVPRWLNEADLRPYLIAMTPAQPKHGGAGALYVLLKRRRN